MRACVRVCKIDRRTVKSHDGKWIKAAELYSPGLCIRERLSRLSRGTMLSHSDVTRNGSLSATTGERIPVSMECRISQRLRALSDYSGALCKRLSFSALRPRNRNRDATSVTREAEMLEISLRASPARFSYIK